MKLAFCLFKYFPHGGLQRDFLRIASFCLQQGASVDIFTREWVGDRPKGFTVHLIKTFAFLNHTKNTRFIKKVLPRFKQYDLIIGFNKMPGLDIYFAADICYQEKALKRSFFYRLLPRYRSFYFYEKQVFARSQKTKILLLSAKQQMEFIKHYQTESHRLYLLPPGISQDRILTKDAPSIRDNFRKQLHIQNKQILLLFIGSGFRTKGLDRLLRAIHALPLSLRQHVVLHVLGKGSQKKYKHLARKFKIASQVHFQGGRDDIPNFLIAADFLIHPAYYENTGTVLLEAQVAGLPVITTDVCGYAHHIKTAGSGIVLPSPFSENAFHTHLKEMLTSADRKIWQQNALQYAKNTDLYGMVEKAFTVIQKTYAEKKVLLNFDNMMRMPGEIFRNQNGRVTQKIIIDNQPLFIKKHYGVGFPEIFKNLFQLKVPIISAKNEWLALKYLQKLNILAPEALLYGSRGINPATRESFLVMKALLHTISLDIYLTELPKANRPFIRKYVLIKEVARIARTLHTHGINHRDFYLCHFLLDLNCLSPLKLYLIDLHRAKIRKKTPLRWIIKDLAALYFSSKHCGLTRRDLLCFIKAYRARSLREIALTELNFWQKVKKRGDQLYRRETLSHHMEKII